MVYAKSLMLSVLDFTVYMIDKEKLASLLRETEKAHAQHEKETGNTDSDWAHWYAAYMIDKIR